MAKIIPVLNNEQIDVLKEAGSICVGNCSGVLSQLLGGRIEVQPSTLEVVTNIQVAEYLREKGKLVFGVNAQITSFIHGSIFLIFSEKDALKIIDRFLKDLAQEGVGTIQIGISIIKEIGGIALFSYVNTLSSLVRKLIVSSIPSFLSGTVDELLKMILQEYDSCGDVCIINTFFHEKSLNIDGGFYLVLDRESINTILESMGTPST